MFGCCFVASDTMAYKPVYYLHLAFKVIFFWRLSRLLNLFVQGWGLAGWIIFIRVDPRKKSTDRSSEKKNHLPRKTTTGPEDHRTRGPEDNEKANSRSFNLFLRKRGSLNCITFLRRIKFFPSASHSLPQIPTCSSSCTSCSSCLSPSCSCHWSSDSQSWQSLNRLNRLKVKITTSSHAPPKAVPTLDLGMTRLFSCGVVVLHLFMQPSGSPPDGSLAELDLKVKSGSSISSSKGRNLAWMHTKC